MKKCRENSSVVRTKRTNTVDGTSSSTKFEDVAKENGYSNTTVKGGKKTWFEVLRESPKKDAKRVSVRNKTPFDNGQIIEPQQLRRFALSDMGKFNLSLDDENFLQKLIEINQEFQDVHAGAVKQAYYLKHQIRSPDKCSQRYATHAGPRNIPITDDDKFNYQKPRAEYKSVIDSRERRERQNLQVKATVKLLENMQNVSENTEIQLEALHNITKLILQLKEEKNMLDKLKEMRIDLESKLASLSTENSYLIKRLQTAENDRDKANRRLTIKEHEIDVLKKHIFALKGTIASKIGSSMCDLNEASYDIPILDETIASLPSNNQSFNAPIRPASSSPVEDDLSKWKRYDITQSNSQHEIDNANIVNLLELKTNVKKTVDQLERESTKLNDVSLNLSDATYKLSSLSLV